MPRHARIDAPGALHHVIVRGIERKFIFFDETDKDRFLERLGAIITRGEASCFAFALLDNHVHLLLRTGLVPVSLLMRRLLTGYAVSFNRRHHRSGHLFQNRYKSILCEDDPYFLQLVRYIHLNPLRAGMVHREGLDSFPWSGHMPLLGTRACPWQDTQYVLSFFGGTRASYGAFARAGSDQGRRSDLTGGV